MNSTSRVDEVPARYKEEISRIQKQRRREKFWVIAASTECGLTIRKRAKLVHLKPTVKDNIPATTGLDDRGSESTRASTRSSVSTSLFLLKQRPREFRLPNDAQQRAASNRVVKRNGNSYRGCLQALLHDLMASSLAYSGESVLFKNPTNLRARKNSKLTQPAPQPGSRTLRCESVE